MIAIQFRKSIPRYLALKALGPRWPGIYTSALSPIALRDLPVPNLPAQSWVRVRPILSGICGSDIAAICGKSSAYLSPLTSSPFVLGHEVVGTVIEVGSQAEGVSAGDRVVLQPALGCRVRGIDPMCVACSQGSAALCRNVTRGNISEGLQTGYCRDTGGAWSECLTAHPSQLYKVPDSMDEMVAVLTEPFACALHGVLRAGLDCRSPMNDERSKTVLVMGCGSIGLLTIAAIRALYDHPGVPRRDAEAMKNRLRIVAVAKYHHQKQHALRLGADEVLLYSRNVQGRYRQLAHALGAELFRPEIGKPTVLGGADVTFDCVASSTSIDDCCRFTRAGGDVVLVGMPAVPKGIDWTSIWHSELTVHAAYAYGREKINGSERSTFEWAIKILEERGSQLRPLVGSPFSLRNYRGALHTALHAAKCNSVKTVFRIATDGK